MSYIPPDPRWQMQGYLEGEAARLQERNSRSGLSGLPLLPFLLVLPFFLLFKIGSFLWRKIRRA